MIFRMVKPNAKIVNGTGKQSETAREKHTHNTTHTHHPIQITCRAATDTADPNPDIPISQYPITKPYIYIPVEYRIYYIAMDREL